MHQMSVKDIFYEILSDDKQREKMNSLSDQHKTYDLFCQNGYNKSFDDFKTEMDSFLLSDDILKIMKNNFSELSDEMLEGVAGGVNIKRVVTTGISALMATFCVSGSITSVGAAGPEQSVEAIVTSVDNCSNHIEDLERDKVKINEERENEIKKIDSEINNDKQLLEYLLNLIADGEDHEADCKNVESRIENNEKNKTKINNDSEKRIGDLNKQIETKKAEKTRLEKELNDLLNQQDNNLENQNREMLEEYSNKHNDFMRWRISKKIANNNDTTKDIRAKTNKLASDLRKQFNADKAEEFIKLAKETMTKMDQFKQEYEDLELAQQLQKEEQQLINNQEMNKETFEKLLAGDQHIDNKRVVEGKEVKVKNTCGIHVITTLKNIYDYMDGKREGFVQGFKNVIENYLANGGDKKLLYTPIDNDNVGQMLMSGDFKGFLQKNKIGMHRVNFFHMVGFKNQNEIDNYKNKLKEKIKSFLVNYMEGKNFAPVATVAGGHWQLLAKYDKQTNQILRLDSAPAEAKWVDIDTIAMNFIHVDNGIVEFEMPIFTKTEGISDINIDGVDDFTLAKQQEIIKKIG